MPDLLTLRPIGVIHTPFPDKVSAPRQTYVKREAEGRIVLEPGRDFEHALSDIEGWDHLWVLYWFHLNEGWRPKVLPPRSKVRRGVFSTRSPHRPSPIGMSVVRLVRVEGLTLFVEGVDMVDGTPVLDIKPYVVAADSIPDARDGWLRAGDPLPDYEVAWSPLAREQAEWLRANHGVDLSTPVELTLALGPEPHPYRRIRKDAAGSTLAVKDWRVRFRVDSDVARRVIVTSIDTGYRAAQLADAVRGSAAVHRAFVSKRWSAGDT
jgi:tRNA-Thr(GGU) m(6)t(6)A37 methyltransferase TsaA